LFGANGAPSELRRAFLCCPYSDAAGIDSIPKSPANSTF
jgi:hypothetical protein